MRELPVFPDQASNFAAESDALYWTLTLLTAIFTLLVFAMVGFLAVKYRRGNRVDRSNPVHHSSILEMSWSIGPMILGLAVFVWSAKLFAQMYGQAPKNSMEIYVIGKQWMWHLQHPNGIRENNELHVPLGRPIKLTMISQDVIHSFFIPAFRIKRDVIPGLYSTVWFTPTKTGKYHLFCAEYCGTQHSEMTGSVYVMEPAEFQKWLASGGQRMQDTQPLPRTMAEAGKLIYEQQGCGNCHDADGMNRGPSLAGLYGSQVKMKSGQMTTADGTYLRKAIMTPNEEIADTYQQIMPAYKDQITEEQLLQLIEHIRSMGGRSAPGSPRGVVPDAGTTGSRALTGNTTGSAAGSSGNQQ
jgi:cytochrome c oxidase subunit II